MAIKYLWSGATGAGNGNSFADAYTTLAAAAAGIVAGDTILVAHDHDERPAAALTATLPGTVAAGPNRMISVNRTTGLYQQGALFGTTGAFNLQINGLCYYAGINFNPAGPKTSTLMGTVTLSGGGIGAVLRVRDCLITTTNNIGSKLIMSASRAMFEENVSVDGGNVNCNVRGPVIWRNSVPYIGTIPLFLIDSGFGGDIVWDGLDMSAGGYASKTIMQGGGTMRRLWITGCKLNPSLNIGTPASYYEHVSIAASGDTAERSEFHSLLGSQVIERTIVRTGGASDGIDNIAFKVVTGAAANREFNLFGADIQFDVAAGDVGQARTATVHVVTDNVTLTDAECFLELSAATTASSFQQTLGDDAPVDPLATPVAQPASTVTWTTTGLATPVKQKLEVAFTPRRAGPHRARVRIGRPSTTVYVCPKVEIAA